MGLKKYTYSNNSIELENHHNYCIENNIPMIRIVRRLNYSMIILDTCTLNDATIKRVVNKDIGSYDVESYLLSNDMIKEGSTISGVGKSFCYIKDALIDKDEDVASYLYDLYMK